jgi:hypothetical protein
VGSYLNFAVSFLACFWKGMLSLSYPNLSKVSLNSQISIYILRYLNLPREIPKFTESLWTSAISAGGQCRKNGILKRFEGGGNSPHRLIGGGAF